MKTKAKKIFAFLISAIVTLSLMILMSYLFQSEQEFKIYKNGQEVEVIELDVGVELPIGYNESLFEECSKTHRNVSQMYIVNVLKICMNNTEIKPIRSNVTKGNISLQWVNANCEIINKKHICGEYEVRLE